MRELWDKAANLGRVSIIDIGFGSRRLICTIEGKTDGGSTYKLQGVSDDPEEALRIAISEANVLRVLNQAVIEHKSGDWKDEIPF